MPLKAELETSLARLTVTINPLLEALRQSGECCLCKSQNGTQHKKTCPSWNVIIAKSRISVMQDEIALSDPPPWE